MWQLILHLYYTLSLLHIHLIFSALPPAQIGLRNVDLNLILEKLAKKVDQTMLENEIEAWVYKFEFNYFLFIRHSLILKLNPILSSNQRKEFC